MSIFSQFYLYTIPQTPAGADRFIAFHAAINRRLGPLRIRAPFVKLAPTISVGARPGVFVYQGIAQLSIDDDPNRVTLGDIHDGRRTLADWATAALRAVEAELGWDASQVLEIAAEVGAHQGVYRDALPKLAVQDEAGRRWIPVFEWDEAGTRLVVEATIGTGEVVQRRVLHEQIHPMILLYERLAVRKLPGRIEYGLKYDTVLGVLELDADPVTVGPASSEPSMEAAIPRRARPGRSDMALDLFWALVDRLDWSRPEDADHVVEPLVSQLGQMTRRERRAFDNTLARLLFDIDGRAWARHIGDAWKGEPDDVHPDLFLFARAAAVARGRDYYERVRRDPTALTPDEDFEPLLYVTETARLRIGEEDEFETRLSYETFSNSDGWD